MRAARRVMEERARAIDVCAVVEIAGEDVDLFGTGHVMIEARPLRAGLELDFERLLHAVAPELADVQAGAGAALGEYFSGDDTAHVGLCRCSQTVRRFDALDLREMFFIVTLDAAVCVANGDRAVVRMH